MVTVGNVTFSNGTGTKLPLPQPRCKGEGCKHLAVRGASYCTEDHYEELQNERKAKNSYRIGTSAPTDYTSALKPASNPVPVKPQKRPGDRRAGRVLPPGITKEQILAQVHLSANELIEKFGISRSTAMRFRRDAGTSQPAPVLKSKATTQAPITPRPAETLKEADRMATVIAEFESEAAQLEERAARFRKAAAAIRECHG